MPEYSYGKTLLKIEDVSLEYDGRPILKNVSAEIKAGAPGRPDDDRATRSKHVAPHFYRELIRGERS